MAGLLRNIRSAFSARLKFGGNSSGSIFNVSIRAKLIILAGTLLVVLIASNLNLRFEIADGNDALQQQATVQDRLRTS